MLYVLFTRASEVNGVIYDNDSYFDVRFKPEWYTSDFAKRLMKESDNVELVKDYLLISKLLGYIPPQYLLGSVKTLLNYYNTNRHITDLAFIGENLTTYLLELSKLKDIYCVCSTSYHMFSNYKFDAICLNDNSKIDGKVWYIKMFEIVYNGNQPNDILRYLR